MHVDSASAPSGRSCIPVDSFDQLGPPTRGLPPKQFTLPAVGSNNQDCDPSDGRQHNKLNIQLFSPDAQAPVRGAPQAAGYDLFACADVGLESRDRELMSTGASALAPPVTCNGSARAQD
eukprot:2646308-Pyramimonas_sp.AAC.1